MKKYFLFFCLLLITISCNKDIEPTSFNKDGEPITMDQAKYLMKDILSTVDFAFMYNSPIPAKTSFIMYDYKEKTNVETTSPEYDAWMFIENPFYFSDMIPTYYNCYYVNTLSGKIELVKLKSPPQEGSGELFSMTNFVLLVDAGSSPDTKTGEREELLRGFNPTPVVTHSGHTYAVIIDGGNNQNYNHMRYWNMCQFLYRTLKLKYGLDDDDIYTLVCGGPSTTWYFSNGYSSSSYLDFDLDGYDDIDYSATSTNIDTVFDDISDIAMAGDNLLVFVTDHGGLDNNTSSICLWGSEDYYPGDLKDQILKINSGVRIHVVLGQCHSGGFYPTITRSNVSLTTSCLASESANVLYGDSTYSEFLYHWICAMAGMTPSGNTIDADSNDDGFVSYYEAFVYARDHDYYHLYCSGNDTETPQYHNFTLYFGENHDIVGNHCYVPRFFTVSSGIDVSYNTSETLTVTDVPPGATPVFYVSSNLSIVSYGNNYVTFKYAGSQPAAEGNIVGFNVYKNNAHYNWHKDNITGWRGGVYNGQNNIELSYGGNPARFALPLLFQNCNSFSWSSSVPSWYPLVQDYYAYFNTDDILPGVGDTVTVSFYNPLGEYTVISEVLSDMGYDIDYQ
jgi:Peptidase C13 family.